MKQEAERYQQRGVSAQKGEVHQAVSQHFRGASQRGQALSQSGQAVNGFSQPGERSQAVSLLGEGGEFPQAFCTILPDVLTGDEGWCLVQHADGAGSKSAAAYLQYRETGDVEVFKGLAEDAMVMNTDDVLCVGALGPYVCSNTLGRNARRVPLEGLEALLEGFSRAAERLGKWGVQVHLAGGETADVGDVVQTLLVDVTLTTRLRRSEVIDGQGIRPGDVIVGLASFGQTTYEERYNSGIGSNGLTSARHELLSQQYAAKYPETVDSLTPPHLRYNGSFTLADSLPGTPLSIGQALLSPTRSYLPLIKPLLSQHRELVSGLVHCTGGGQTKCLKLGKNIHYIKHQLFEPPPLFRLIQSESQTSWREMYQVFNMGHRLEVIGRPEILEVLKKLAKPLQLEVQQIGRCEAVSQGKNRNQLTLSLPSGKETF